MPSAETKATHTPGPWTVSGPGIFAISPWNARVRIASADLYSPVNGIDGIANVRLMAAAPELLEVARAYEAWEATVIVDGNWSNATPRMSQAMFDRLLEIQAMRNAALAKAKGEA